MAIIRLANQADYTFKAGSLPADKLKVVSFSGREAISGMFSVNFDLAATDSSIDFDAVINQPGVLTIHGPADKKRYIHGLIRQFEQAGKGGKFTQYIAEMVPSLWLLSLRKTSRIFQSQTIPDIIKKVLTDAGIASDQFRFSLKKQYTPREYCVQYRETDFIFVSRLMEQYGIFYFFEHSADKDVMVMGDDSVVHVSIGAPDKVMYGLPSLTEGLGQEYISSYRYQSEIRSGAAKLRDFDFKKPKLNLSAEAQAPTNGKLEIYDYPGEYEVPDEGKGLAKVRLEELQATRRIGSGQSDCRRLMAGYRFKLASHERSAFNIEYLLVSVSHSGSQSQVLGADGGGEDSTTYSNSFVCIPADIPYRPARITGKPTIAGPQTAIVVGPSGEEIYTDEHGRVKVQFHWDREGKGNDKSSCWIRVAQLWAGANWGAMFIPRIGQEVIVEFLEGDPDRPIITGRVYNGENLPPYSLPAEKTKSTIKSNSSKGGGGSNEFRFEDVKGSEEVYLHGQKDWTILIENDKNQKIGHDETLEVGNDRTKKVVKNQSEDVGENKTIKVGKDHTEEIGDNKTISVGKDHTEKIGDNATIDIGKNETISIGKNMTLTVGKDLSESVTDNADSSIGKNLSLNVGKNSSSDVGENLSANVGKKGTLQVGDALGVDVGKKLTIHAADAINIASDKEIVLKAGDASITLKKSGDIIIKGGKITLNASGDLVMKGSKITQN